MPGASSRGPDFRSVHASCGRRIPPAELDRQLALYVGRHHLQGTPIHVLRDQLANHVLWLGKTGSGKTSLGVLPMVWQLLHQRDADGKPHRAIIVVDLKGDNVLFQLVRREAARAGRRFRFLTHVVGKTTFSYNTFGSHRGKSRITKRELAERLIDAMGINHGAGFGRSYFTRRQLDFLLSLLLDNRASSFQALHDACNTVQDERVKRDIYELICLVHGLAEVPQLNVENEHSIQISDVLEGREVVYLDMPVSKGSQISADITKLVCYDVLAHVTPENAAYVFIDEFPQCVCRGFSVMLQQGRGLGMSLLLSAQTLTDLRSEDANLVDSVWTNCHYRQLFDVPNPETADFVKRALGTETYLNSSPRWHTRVPLFDKFETAGFEELNGDPFLSLVSIPGDPQTYGLPVPVRTQHCLSLEEYKHLQNEPWPTLEEFPGTIEVTVEEPRSKSKARPRGASAVASQEGRDDPETVSTIAEGLRKLAGEGMSGEASVPDEPASAA